MSTLSLNRVCICQGTCISHVDRDKGIGSITEAIKGLNSSHVVVGEGDKSPGGGGGTQVQRGASPSLRISQKKVFFLRPPHVRDFVKEGYFFVPRYEVWVSKSPYNPRDIRGSDAE